MEGRVEDEVQSEGVSVELLVTPQLKQILQNSPDTFERFYKSDYRVFLDQLTEHGSVEQIYREVDKMVEILLDSAGRDKVTCLKCTTPFCCSASVDASQDEIEHIKKYVKENGIEADPEPMIKAYESVLGTKERGGNYLDEYFQLRVPCMFLKNGRCSIYSERPISCRKYYVGNPVWSCSYENGQGTESDVPVQVVTTISLEYLYAKVLEKDVKAGLVDTGKLRPMAYYFRKVQ